MLQQLNFIEAHFVTILTFVIGSCVVNLNASAGC